MHRIIPERFDRLVLHIRTAHADVLECFVAQARQHFALAMQFVPAADLVQQIGYHVNRVLFCTVKLMLTFHLVALRLDGSSLAPGLRSIQRMFLMSHISEIDGCLPTRVSIPKCCVPSSPSPTRAALPAPVKWSTVPSQPSACR